MADALSLLRLVLAVPLPWLLLDRHAGALVIWAAAAGSDWLDGRVARRFGGSRWGGVLDVAGDVVFVGSGLVTGAVLGFVPVVAPVAVGCAVIAYAVASRHASRGGTLRLAHSRLGHAGGVVNWICVGLLAAAPVLPEVSRAWLLWWTGVAVAVVNGAAALARALPR